MPFAITKDGRLFFALEHSISVQFKFVDLIEVQMNWFYFNILFIGKVTNPLLKIEHASTAIKCSFLLLISNSNATCCVAATNEWIILDKSGCFEVHSNLNITIK